MKIKVLDAQGKETGREVTLPAEVFGIEPNDHAIYLDVKQFLANQRQGTHKSKERGEIRGSRKKIRKQKGSGGARFGDIKNPLFKGGGRIFGPKPRNYGFKLNKKVKALARMSALTYRAQDAAIIIVEDLKMDAPKTKNFASFLSSVGAAPKSLYVQGDVDKNVIISARNLPKANVSEVSKLNTYEILNCQNIIFSESSVKHFAK